MMCFINMNVWIKVISITVTIHCLEFHGLYYFTKRGMKTWWFSLHLLWRSKLGQYLPWRGGDVFSMVDGTSMVCYLSVILGPANITPMSSLFKSKIWHSTCWIKISRKEVIKCPVILMHVDLWETLVYGAERHYWTHRLHVHIHSRYRHTQNPMESWGDKEICRDEKTAVIIFLSRVYGRIGHGSKSLPVQKWLLLQFLGYIIFHKFLNFCKLWLLQIELLVFVT